MKLQLTGKSRLTFQLDRYGGSKPLSCKKRAKLKQWHIQHAKLTCTQTATFESRGARTNKGVSNLNIELKRQKLDQTDSRNRKIRRIAFTSDKQTRC